MRPATKTFDLSKLEALKLGVKPPSVKTWAEMVEADQHGDEAEAVSTEEAVADAKTRLDQMLKQVADEKGAEGVEGLLFAMGLAAETLAADFKDGRFTECPEVVEEDVFRLRRVVNEALTGGVQ